MQSNKKYYEIRIDKLHMRKDFLRTASQNKDKRPGNKEFVGTKIRTDNEK